MLLALFACLAGAMGFGALGAERAAAPSSFTHAKPSACDGSEPHLVAAASEPAQYCEHHAAPISCELAAFEGEDTEDDATHPQTALCSGVALVLIASHTRHEPGVASALFAELPTSCALPRGPPVVGVESPRELQPSWALIRPA